MEKKKTIEGVIITYNPNIPLLKKNITAVQRNLDKDYMVIDNGSRNVDDIRSIVGESHLIRLGSNLGIGTAQNVGFICAIERGYRWVLLLDQDSILPFNLVSSTIATKEFNDSNTGIIGVPFSKNESSNQGLVKKDFVIASGSLINVSAWRKVGRFDDKLFIDYVDFDFDARLKSAGFECYENTDLMMEHQLGVTIIAPIFGRLMHLKKFHGEFSDHSPQRLFYYYKNSIIVRKRYPNYFRDGKHPVWTNLKRSREILIFKRPKIRKIIWGIFGIICGAFYNPDKDIKFQKTMQKLLK